MGGWVGGWVESLTFLPLLIEPCFGGCCGRGRRVIQGPVEWVGGWVGEWVGELFSYEWEGRGEGGGSNELL